MENIYRTFFENSVDALIVFNLENNTVVTASKAATALTGYTLDELTNMPPLTMLPDYEKERVENKRATSLANFRHTSECFRLDILRKDGRIIKVETNAFHIEFSGNKYTVGQLRDISARIEEEKRQREHEQLLIQQSKLASMGEMLSHIAHQWRQPLSSMSGILLNVQLALKNISDYDNEISDLLTDAFRVIRFMSNTIDDFRNFFSPSKTIEKFRMFSAVEDALSIIAHTLVYHGIRTEITIGADPVISGFKNEFSHAVLNILQNAKDILLIRKPEEPEIRIEIKDTENGACLMISDNGGGIKEENISKVFEPYYSTRSSGQGIGLYMSKMIIEKSMKGSLSVRNANEGAEFIITV
jgi:PAS domain S-box-containing protein